MEQQPPAVETLAGAASVRSDETPSWSTGEQRRVDAVERDS